MALSLHDIDPVNVRVKDLNVRVTPLSRYFGFLGVKNKKALADPILTDVSLEAKTGSVMAIIGGSGSGKTSLLNVMASRMSSSNLVVSGVIDYNGNTNISNIRTAYVIQQDILDPHLTCRETLEFAADLRLPSSSSHESRRALVDEVILELGLKECANTRVGDSMHKGLSGGEKRRLSIGIQLLANPSVLFLDEPTTGLDANSAYLLVETCHMLSRKGRTIVMSVHQPRSDIFFLFDRVTLLAKGNLVYSGAVTNMLPYFESLGFFLPTQTNPADFFIDTAAVDTRTEEAETDSLARVKKLCETWARHSRTALSEKIDEPVLAAVTSDFPSSETSSQEPLNDKSMSAPLPRQIMVLTKRAFLVSARDPMGYFGLFLECVLMGVICGWIFYKLDGSLTGMRSMEGLLYTATAAQGYLILIYETYRLCGPDLKVFDREHNEGCASPLGYLVSRRLAKCLTEDLYVPLIFSVIIYFMSGLRTDSARYFFVFFGANLVMQYIAVCFAMMCASISRDFTTAALFGNLGYTLQSMACGFFVNVKDMPVYVRWTRWIAYVYYGFGTLISNQFTDFMGDCPYPPSDERCFQYSGDYILEVLHFPANWIVLPIFVNVAWAIGFYAAAYLFLRFFRQNVSIAKKHVSPKEQMAEMMSRSEPIAANITVKLLNIKVSVTRRSVNGVIKYAKDKLLFRKTSENVALVSRNIDILRGITATFEPGSINAILGPSGSGKSSLLNYVAGRIKTSLTQKYHSSGQILFNDKIPSPSVIHSVCSYVTQDDDGLLPSLTVRETLFYAACLRLPSHMSRSQKMGRANQVISQMGLKDCADTLIGNEMIKGISGGEKRRVSVSIQLLNDPKILLLDEPTSGLDSFTAASILEVLRHLAEEGRTIICTIHQPRSDLYSQFGNILLLAKGGCVAYDGKGSKMLDYFDSIGIPCPDMTNPSDFVLDVVSVNLQSVEKEVKSREKVDHILESWKQHERTQSNAVSFTVNKREMALPAEFRCYSRSPAAFGPAYFTLLRRSTVNFSRSPDMIVARIMQVVGIGIIFALFFSPLKDGYTGIIDRLGLVQEVTALYFVGMLNNMAIYPHDRNVFYREHDDSVYGVLPFFLVYLTLEVPFEIVTSLIFAVFLVIIPGLPRTPEMYFATAYATWIIVNCGESIGIMFNTMFLHEGFAVNLISVVLSIGSIMSGIMSLNMPGFLKGVNWLSPLKYSVAVIINLAFESQPFSCEGQVVVNGTCQFDNGNKVLEGYKLKAHVPTYLGAMAVCLVIYRGLAFALLKLALFKK